MAEGVHDRPEQVSRGRTSSPAGDDDSTLFPAPKGRRARPAEQPRVGLVQFRVNDAEMTVAATGATNRGMVLGNFARQAVLAAASGQPAPRPVSERERRLREDLRAIAETRTQLVRIGTLLNQAVAALNSTGEAPPGLPYLAGRVEVLLRRLDEQTALMVGRDTS